MPHIHTIVLQQVMCGLHIAVLHVAACWCLMMFVVKLQQLSVQCHPNKVDLKWLIRVNESRLSADLFLVDLHPRRRQSPACCHSSLMLWFGLIQVNPLCSLTHRGANGFRERGREREMSVCTLMMQNTVEIKLGLHRKSVNPYGCVLFIISIKIIKKTL